MLGFLKRSILQMLPNRITSKLRTWRVQRMIQTYQVRVVEHMYGKNKFQIQLGDPLGQGWYDKDWPELPEITALRQRLLRPGKRVFDLGAHQGVVALMLAAEVGPTGQVIALEPNPHNFLHAVKNRDLNNMPHLQFEQAAVSDSDGTLIFNEGLNGCVDDGNGRWGQMVVTATTIDTLSSKYGLPDVIFLDVEGAECRAMAGAANTTKHTCDYFVEVHVGCGLETLGGSVERILSYFPADRYELMIRAEADTIFRPMQTNDPLTRDRFFMLALDKKMA